MTQYYILCIVILMRSIVLSKVLKYKSIYIGISLVLILAFFQSNQALGESSTNSNSANKSTTKVSSPETPSTPETPDLPRKPDLPKNNSSSTKISIVITTSTNINDSSIDYEPDKETTIERIERETTNESISITFKSNGEEQNIKEKIDNKIGRVSVKLKTRSHTSSENETSQETTIEKESSTH